MIRLGNNVFDVPTPGAMRSFALQQRILPVAGRVVNVFLHLLGQADSADLTKLLGSDVLRVLPAAMPALGDVFSSMPKGELEYITRELLTGTTWDKKPLFGSADGDAFDGLMRGRTMDTWKLLWHALEVWYPDFFARAAALFASGAKEKPSEASST